MRIEIDLAVVPPAVALLDAGDMKGFSVRVLPASHTFVDRSALLEMAGERAGDPEWRIEFDAMVAYAQSRGWVREADGAIRAHIEQ